MNSQFNTSNDSLNIVENGDTSIQKINSAYDLKKSIIEKEDVANEVNKYLELNIETEENKGLFKVKTANSWIEESKTRPVPKMLFGKFWFEYELCILFADTNLGKSILAVQIGYSISRGEPIEGFELEAIKQPILYCDFEQSGKQFENRYSLNYDQHYDFDKNFYRIEINPDANIPVNVSFEDYLNQSLESSLTEIGAKILIVDNLTFLKSETEKAKDALPLMKHLKALKSKYGLSILALAHTPKRDLYKPITRYIKQIKARNTEIIFNTENVCVCQINKPFNFLKFEFIKQGTELEHLKQSNKEDKEIMIQKIMDLNEQNLSFREIGNKLGISHMKVSRILKDCNNL
ncbi:MAG: AAA family ATPase [Saprospiraceae bacterium]|nr:AAA family ATPase [Saprospiraceae bacterium]